MENFLLFTDGGARGNPGIAGAGAVLCQKDGTVAQKIQVKLGIRTNNQAEYEGLLAGLQMATKEKIQKLTVFMDSNLIVEQMSGRFKVKNPELRELHQAAMKLAVKIPFLTFQHIPREKNKLADEMANRAMDAQK